MKYNLRLRNKYAGKYRQTPLVDSKKADEKWTGSAKYRPDILEQANVCWESMRYWRDECRRNERFVYGNQWGDYTKLWDEKNEGWVSIREDELMLREGAIPITNNVLLSILRSVAGLFISNQTEPVAIARARDKQEAGEVASATLQMVYTKNKLWDLDRDKLMQYMIHGFVAGLGKFSYRDLRKDVLFDDIQYDRFFFDNTMQDPRGLDCKILGIISDLSLEDVISIFSGGNPKRAAGIKEVYGGPYSRVRNVLYDSITDANSGNDVKDFYIPQGAFEGLCRVITVWRKECTERIMVHDRLHATYEKADLSAIRQIEEENASRIADYRSEGIEPEDMREGLIEYERFFDRYWAYYFLSPDGYVLDSGETPYKENTCPVVFKFDFGADMKVHPYVSGYIEQQKIINRNLSVQDYVNRVSIKGAVFYPEEALPDNVTHEENRRLMARPGAYITYKASKGAPFQVTNNASNTGAYQMVNMELSLLEKISGVSNSVQGVTPKSNTPASLYAQQTQNSIGSLSVILDSYRDYRENRDRMLFKLIQQFYTEEMYINTHSSKEVVLFDPKMINGVDFEVSIVESQSSPAFRMVANDMLLRMMEMGAITPKMALQLGYFAFSDKAIQLMEEEEEKMRNAAIEAQQQGAMPVE